MLLITESLEFFKCMTTMISTMIKTATRTITATAKMMDMERDLALEAEVSTFRVSQLILTSMEVLEISLDVEYSNLW